MTNIAVINIDVSNIAVSNIAVSYIAISHVAISNIAVRNIVASKILFLLMSAVRLGENDLHPVSLKTPAPHIYQLIDRK